jgi:hypothetical protein
VDAVDEEEDEEDADDGDDEDDRYFSLLLSLLPIIAPFRHIPSDTLP